MTDYGIRQIESSEEPGSPVEAFCVDDFRVNRLQHQAARLRGMGMMSSWHREFLFPKWVGVHQKGAAPSVKLSGLQGRSPRHNLSVYVR